MKATATAHKRTQKIAPERAVPAEVSTPIELLEEALGRYVKTPQAAQILQVSQRTLESWRRQRRGPNFIRLSGHLCLYEIAELRRYVCVFRPMSITDSGASRSRIPVGADHRFRSMPINDRLSETGGQVASAR